jgi:hypothetical protein
MALPYLSPSWFDAARACVGQVSGGAGLSCRLGFVADHSGEQVCWSQVIDEGCVVEWGLGRCDDADIEVHLSLEHAWRVWSGLVDGNEALAGLTVVEERPAGRWVGPPAPMDLGEQDELTDLPVYPGASMDVQYEYSRGPFGPVEFGLSIVDGQVRAMSLGVLPAPDVRVECTFMQMARVRRGDITILDALADGARVSGEEGAIALLGGMSESPEFRTAELACGRSGLVLGVLGEIYADSDRREALLALASETGPPDGI